MDIQKQLDEWLASNPEFQKYVTKLYFVPDGSVAPEDATHEFRLNSTTSMERALTIAAVVVPKYAAFLDMILAMVATQPPL